MNDPNTAFCRTCGARLAPAPAAAAAGGYPPPSGAAAGSGAPSGWGSPAGYGPPGGQAPNGYPQGQYQPGQYQPGQSGPYGQRSSGLPPVDFNLARLTVVDKVVAVASLVTLISLWLPWYTVRYSVLGATSSGSVSGTHVHGWLWFEFLVALALVAYIAARAAWQQLPFPLPFAPEIVLIAGTSLQLLLILIGFAAKPSTDGYAGFSVGWGFGAFLALLAALVAAGPVCYPAIRSYLDSRKAGGARPF